MSHIRTAVKGKTDDPKKTQKKLCSKICHPSLPLSDAGKCTSWTRLWAVLPTAQGPRVCSPNNQLHRVPQCLKGTVIPAPLQAHWDHSPWDWQPSLVREHHFIDAFCVMALIYIIYTSQATHLSVPVKVLHNLPPSPLQFPSKYGNIWPSHQHRTPVSITL